MNKEAENLVKQIMEMGINGTGFVDEHPSTSAALRFKSLRARGEQVEKLLELNPSPTVGKKLTDYEKQQLKFLLDQMKDGYYVELISQLTAEYLMEMGKLLASLDNPYFPKMK